MSRNIYRPCRSQQYGIGYKEEGPGVVFFSGELVPSSRKN
jgi:hypothetical protein